MQIRCFYHLCTAKVWFFFFTMYHGVFHHRISEILCQQLKSINVNNKGKRKYVLFYLKDKSEQLFLNL